MAKKGWAEIKGKTALITGGARGMGVLWARHLLKDGARVVLWDLSDELEKTRQMFLEEGFEVATAKVDVTDPAQVHKAGDYLRKSGIDVDILINNAGIVAGGPFAEVPVERSVLVLEVNLKGLVHVTREFLPAMVERDDGCVVNVSSASGFIGVPYMATYTASKWGVLGFTDSLRLEMKLEGKKGVHFAVFCPSYVDTGLFEGAKAPFGTPLLTTEEAVRRAYKAFRRGAYVIKEPFMVKVTPTLRALLPTSVFDSIASALGATHSMKDWKGRDK